MERNGNAFIDGPLELGKVRDDGLEHIFAKCLSNLREVRELEGPGALELGDDVAEQPETLVVVALDSLDDGPDAGRAAGTPIGRLQGDDDEIGGTEGRVAGQRHSRRAVQQNVVVGRPKFGHGVGQGRVKPLTFPLARLREVLPGKMARHRDDVDVRVLSLVDEVLRLRVIARVKEPFDAGGVGMIGKKALGDIRLLVQVHDQAAPAALLANRSDQPTEVRLADSALEIERRDDLGTMIRGSIHVGILASRHRWSRIILGRTAHQHEPKAKPAPWVVYQLNSRRLTKPSNTMSLEAGLWAS